LIGNLTRIHQHNGVRLSRRALRVLARENFLNFAKYLVDFFHFLHLQPDRMNRLIHFGVVPQVLDDLLAKGKGVIVLSAHLGNWELGAAALAQRGYPFHAVALRQPDPKLDALYQSYRSRRRINPIPFGRAARDCIRILRRNEIIALVGDRDFTAARDTVEFFGQPARLPDGPAKLALATGAPILPTFMVRNDDDTFGYVLGEPIWADKARDQVADVMRKITAALERVISQYSEQWFFFHDLWDIETDRILAAQAAFGETPAEARSQNE
jgi:Kdo2-lipid IVA lauroyltransferase/acyltransferase